MPIKTTPKAILAAQKLIRAEHGRTIPDYRIGFELATEPDQYTVTFTDPRPTALDREYRLIPSLTLSSADFAAWQSWLDGRYIAGGAGSAAWVGDI